MSNINDFVIKDGVLEKYTSNDTEVIIPSSVTSIGRNAFFHRTHVKSVIISDSVRSIGDSAFSSCTSLVNVTIPNSVNSIGDSAFSSCTSLTNITIPNSVKKIGHSTFYDCESLTGVTIPDSVTIIDMYAFSKCKSLAHVTIPDTVKSIGHCAFSGCELLGSVEISDNVTIDGSSPFGQASVEYSNSGKVLIRGNAQNGEVIVKDGTTRILKDALSHLFGWNVASKVRKIVLPDSIRLFDETDLGFEKIDINIPKGYLRQQTKLPVDFTIKLLGNHWKEKASIEDYAYLYIFQTAKKFKELCEKTLVQSPDVAVTTFINILNDNPSNPNFVKVAEFMFNNKSAVSQDNINTVYTMAINSKAKKAFEMLAPLATVTDVAIESKTQKKAKTTATKAKHPIEEMCRKEFASSVIEASIKKANINAKDLARVYYKNSKEKASEFVVMCAIAPYLDIMKERPKQIGAYKSDYLNVSFCEKADKIAAELDRESFIAALIKAAHIQDAHAKPQRLIPLCRFGTSEQIKEVVSYIGKWDEWYAYSSSGRSTIIVARGALMLSDTREAMLYIEKCKLLSEYAKLRGTDEASIRDNVLADFGFDSNGKIIYDLGNTTIEITIAEDLTLSIYDVGANKIVKSIPKKGADADKYEKASAQYSEIKANVKKVVKTRNDMLFEEFLSGKTRSAASWQSSYLKNPILHRVAELIVWKHGRNYFTLSESGAVDSSNNPYEIGESGQIGVAHPMEMTKSEISKWQKYFLSHGLKQPFEQIWEPVVDEKTLKEDRYRGLPIPFYRFRGQLKHGIDIYDADFHNEISITLYGFKAEILRLDWERHSIDVNHRFEIKSIKPYGKFSRSHNHLIAYLDKCTIYGRIKNDDVNVVELLNSFTLAQIMDFIRFANENNSTNVTAAIMDYKNAHYGNESVMDEFVL